MHHYYNSSNYGNVSRKKRNTSLTINLRKYNNQVKYVLLEKYCNKKNYLMDIGCGKGGDIFKYHKLDLGLVLGFDFSINRLKSALDRVKNLQQNENTKTRFIFELRDMNTFCNDSTFFQNKFDIVVFFFTIHYADNILEILTRVSNFLKSNQSKIVITFLDADRLGSSDFENSICSIQKIGNNAINFTLADCVENCRENILHGSKLVDEISAHFRINEYLHFDELRENDDKFVQKYSSLSDEEKQVVKLYAYMTLSRKT